MLVAESGQRAERDHRRTWSDAGAVGMHRGRMIVVSQVQTWSEGTGGLPCRGGEVAEW